MIARSGTVKPRTPAAPQPLLANITKRDDRRARLEPQPRGKALNASPGQIVIIDATAGGGFETIAAEVYAVHLAGKLIDVRLMADLDRTITTVAIRLTGLRGKA